MTPDGGPEFALVAMRDYFAAAALQGILSGAMRHKTKSGSTPDVEHAAAAADAYKYADAMLAERERHV